MSSEMRAKQPNARTTRRKSSSKQLSAAPVARARIDRNIGYLLRRAQLAVSNDLIECFKPFGIRPAQYAVLAVIEANPGINQEQLGDSLGIQRPNLSALLDGLEQSHFVRRERTRHDGRSYALRLTPEGAVRLGELHKAHLVHEQRIGKMLQPPARAALLDALAKLAAITPSEG
jgi:DNA-binding MarR family transcriptional regulator